MTANSALLLASLIALAIGWLQRKPLITAVSGILRRDKRTGQIVLALTPRKKKGKKRK